MDSEAWTRLANRIIVFGSCVLIMVYLVAMR